MRLVSSLIVAALLGILAAPPAALQAQEAEAQTHYLEVTTFHVPYALEAQQGVNWWIDSVWVPMTKMNPNVRSARIGTHMYGSRGGDVILVTEYADWNAINADCEECNAWFQERQPAEGTPEREAWNKAQATFFKYFTGHQDEIYGVSASRRK